MTEIPAFVPQINELLQVLPLAFPSIASVIVKFHELKITHVETVNQGRGFRDSNRKDDITAFVPTGGEALIYLVDSDSQQHQLKVADYRRQMEKYMRGNAVLFLDGNKSGSLNNSQNRCNNNHFEARYRQPTSKGKGDDQFEHFNW